MRGSLSPLRRELPPYGRLAGTPERPALLHPARRQRPLQQLQHQRLIGAPRKDLVGDVGRKQREPQNSASVVAQDVLTLGELSHRSARLPIPPVQEEEAFPG